MKKVYSAVLIWLGLTGTAWAQSQFGIALMNETYSATNDTFCLDLEVSFDSVGYLGSSNFVFGYDTNNLVSPYLQSQAGVDTSIFFPATLTEFDPGMSSFNLELKDLDIGLAIPDGTSPMNLATVCFDVRNPSGNHSVDWSVEEEAGTVLYLENEETQLTPGIVQDYDAPGLFPVEWLGFEVEQIEGKIMLNWATAQEVNNAGFTIGRSVDGLAFGSIGFVPSQGNSSNIQQYSWNDQGARDLAHGQTLYYRLTQTDLDGTTDMSEVRTITLDLTTLQYVNVYPIPALAGQNLQVEFRAPELEKVTLGLYNTLGQPMVTKSFDLNPGLDNQLNLPIPALTSGVYFLRIADQRAVYHFSKLLID